MSVVLVARKDMVWQGQQFARGETLVPQPEGRKRSVLLDTRTVLEQSELSGPVPDIEIMPDLPSEAPKKRGRPRKSEA